MFFVMIIVKRFGIIVSDGINKMSAFLCPIGSHVVRADRDGGISSRIIKAYFGCEFGCDFKSAAFCCVTDLVTDAPHNDAGVVSVALDPRFNVATVPIFEEFGVVMLGLVVFPHIECFVDDYDAHFVAKLNKLDCGHIV